MSFCLTELPIYCPISFLSSLFPCSFCNTEHLSLAFDFQAVNNRIPLCHALLIQVLLFPLNWPRRCHGRGVYVLVLLFLPSVLQSPSAILFSGFAAACVINSAAASRISARSLLPSIMSSHLCNVTSYHVHCIACVQIGRCRCREAHRKITLDRDFEKNTCSFTDWSECGCICYAMWSLALVDGVSLPQ